MRQRIGETLTAGKVSTTLREVAAYALGLSQSPDAIKYLKTALMATDAEKQSKYFTTVRTNAAAALASIYTGGTRLEPEQRQEVRGILMHVEEHDKYGPRRIATRTLDRVKPEGAEERAI